jgi:hypothetical protein
MRYVLILIWVTVIQSISDRTQAKWPGFELNVGQHCVITVMSTAAAESTSLQPSGYLEPNYH